MISYNFLKMIGDRQRPTFEQLNVVELDEDRRDEGIQWIASDKKLFFD